MIVALLWGAVVVRMPTVLRDRRQRALWLSLLALALAESAPGPLMVPNLLGVIAGYFLLRFVLLATGDRYLRTQIAVTAVVVVALVVTAKGGVTHGGPVPYWVVLEAYLGMVFVVSGVLFWTVGRAAPKGLPRQGLYAMATGAFLVAAYAVYRAALITASGLGAEVDFPALQPVDTAVQVTGFLLIVAGGMVPAGRRTREIFDASRDLIVLRPLWTAMRDAFPQVILFTPRRALIELAGVDDVRLRRYRRVIEIRDGMLALRDYLPTDQSTNTDPAREARAIVAALARLETGATSTSNQWAQVGSTMDEEIAWLSKVSREYRRLSAPTPTPAGSSR